MDQRSGNEYSTDGPRRDQPKPTLSPVCRMEMGKDGLGLELSHRRN